MLPSGLLLRLYPAMLSSTSKPTILPIPRVATLTPKHGAEWSAARRPLYLQPGLIAWGGAAKFW
jgi:hypothetical protein